MTKRNITIGAIALILLITIAIIFGGGTQTAVASVEVRQSQRLDADDLGVVRAVVQRSVTRESLGEADVPVTSLEAEAPVLSTDELPVRRGQGNELAEAPTTVARRFDLNRVADNM